jgi:hypothetical protein
MTEGALYRHGLMLSDLHSLSARPAIEPFVKNHWNNRASFAWRTALACPRIF